VHLYAKPELTTVLILFAGALPFAATTTLLFNTLLAFQATRPAITVKYIWEPVGKIVSVGIMVLLGFHIVGVISAIGLVIALGAYMAVKALKGTILTLNVQMNYAWPTRLREFALFCSPVAISNAFGVIAPRSDILILGYWVNANEIGVYLACLQTAGIISLVLGSFETVFAPFIARVLALNDLGQLRVVYQSLSRLVILFTVPLWILLSLLSSPILSLFGEAFRDGWIPLVILTTGHFVSSMASSPNHVLLMGGHSTTVMLNTVVTGLLQVLVALLLIPYFGTVGAAVASAGGLFAITLARVVQVWRRYHIVPFSTHFVKPLVAGGAMVGAMLVARHLLEASPQGMEIPLVGAVGLSTYFGCQLVLGVDPVDKSLMKEITKRVMARVNGSSRG
jgi:O-antigen/teichoic acid export membrane protein